MHMQTQAPDFSNKAYLFPRINREGKKFGIPTLVVAAALVAASAACTALVVCQGPDMRLHTLFVVLAAALALLAGPFLLLAYGVFLFFRDPERYPPEDERAILSPADGRVCMIVESALPPELVDALPEGTPADAKYARVSVFMSVFNVHVNRMPTAARILKKAHVRGKFLNASLDKASSENERCCYLMQTPGGTIYGVVQIAGLVAKRIVPFADAGAELARAERFGLIRFGSRLDVYLPAGTRPEVREGQIMVAGETVLGRLQSA